MLQIELQRSKLCPQNCVGQPDETISPPVLVSESVSLVLMDMEAQLLTVFGCLELYKHK